MSNFAALVDIPDDDAINGGLNSPHNSLMLSYFGQPNTSQKLHSMLATQSVGPFRVTGLSCALASLTQIFAKVKTDKPDLYAAIHTAGMYNCRLQRGSDTLWSNHSFGTAIDLFCGADVVPFGSSQTHEGLLELYPYFHNMGWYWGAEFPRPDGMHFEVSVQTLQRWHSEGLI